MRSTLAVSLLLAGACAGEEPGELTVLDSSQRVLDSGDAVSLEAGPQGGYHTNLLLQGSGLAPGPATVDILATGQDEKSIDYRLPLRLAADGDSSITDHPVLLILCPGSLLVDGSAVHFRWLLTDGQGDQLEARLDLAPTCPAGDDRCPTVCSASSTQAGAR